MEIGDTICMWSFMSALWFDGDLDRKCWQHIHMGSGRSVRQWEFLLEPPDLFYLVFGLLPWWLSIVCIEVGLEPRTCSYSVIVVVCVKVVCEGSMMMTTHHLPLIPNLQWLTNLHAYAFWASKESLFLFSWFLLNFNCMVSTFTKCTCVVFCANFMYSWLSAPTLFDLVALCAFGNCQRIVFLFPPNFELGGSLCSVFSQGFELFSCWYHAQTLKSRVSNLWPLWGWCACTTNWPTILFKTFLIFKP
jgi:hypothetical protein